MNSEHACTIIISDADMAVLRKGGADGLKLALKMVRDFHYGELPTNSLNDIIDWFFEGYSAPSPLTSSPGKRCPDPTPGKRWIDLPDSPPKFTWEIPVMCADSRPNLSPSTVQIGDSAHSANQSNAGEVEVSQSYSADPAPVSSNDTVADQSAPDNHEHTSGVGHCSPSADAAFFSDAPPTDNE